MFSASCRYFIK
nr:unnamed protein product [Callosobruchus chinensis]